MVVFGSTVNVAILKLFLLVATNCPERISSFSVLKFIYSEKATKFCEISTVVLSSHLCSNGQIYFGDLAKFSGLLRIYELYFTTVNHILFLTSSLFFSAKDWQYREHWATQWNKSTNVLVYCQVLSWTLFIKILRGMSKSPQNLLWTSYASEFTIVQGPLNIWTKHSNLPNT